jgi:hypothetical protein
MLHPSSVSSKLRYPRTRLHIVKTQDITVRRITDVNTYTVIIPGRRVLL